MTSRPYRIFGATEQQAAVQRARTALVEWASEWVVAGDTPHVVEATSLSNVSEITTWELFGERNVAFVAVGFGASQNQEILDLFLGKLPSARPSNPENTDHIADSLAQQALRSLAERLYVAAGLDSGTTKAASWSGVLPCNVEEPGVAGLALRCALGHGAVLYYIVLYPGSLDVLAQDATDLDTEPTMAVMHAIASERVSIEIFIGEGELTIEELGTLATGDVLPLGRKLSQEVSVRLDAQTPVCTGLLGSAQGKMAIRITDIK
jgi:Type III flagellar switch regulator (C-ring) FliN C-term